METFLRIEAQILVAVDLMRGDTLGTWLYIATLGALALLVYAVWITWVFNAACKIRKENRRLDRLEGSIHTEEKNAKEADVTHEESVKKEIAENELEIARIQREQASTRVAIIEHKRKITAGIPPGMVSVQAAAVLSAKEHPCADISNTCLDNNHPKHT
jgi:hypothetical protein